MPKRQTQPLTSLLPPADVSLATAELPASSAVETSPRMAASLDAEEPTHVMAAPVVRANASGRVCPKCQSRYTRQQRFCPFDGHELRHASWHPERDELVGKVVAERYAVEELLAEGGMGKVYLVRHTALGSPFAMKVLRADLARDADVVERLRAEARAMASIEHPNIVDVSDMGEIDGTLLPSLGQGSLPFFVMEHAPGCSLAEYLSDRGPLDAQQAIQVVRDVAYAMGAAHDANVIHRDIKPDNIRVSEQGGELSAKVLDFGVAKVIGSTRKTLPGIVFGTPYYMSPEQGSGQPVDSRSDIYALGVVLYECLTGRVPFVGDSFVGVLTQHRTAQLPPLSTYRAEFDGHPLQTIVERCMAKEPAQRYPDCQQLEAALEAAWKTLSQGEQDDALETLSYAPESSDPVSRESDIVLPTQSRRGIYVVLALGLVVACLVGVVALRSGAPKANPTGDGPLPTTTALGQVPAPQRQSSSTAPEPAGSGEAISAEQPSSKPSLTAAPPTDPAPAKAATTMAPAAPGGQAAPVKATPARPRPRIAPKPPPKPAPAPANDVVDPWQ